MAGLIPWRRNQENGGNGGSLMQVRDIPTLMRRMQNEFDDLFDRFAGNMPVSWSNNGWRWGLEVEEKEDKVLVRAEAPGFEAGDFDIQMGDNHLTLRASRKTESKGKEGEARQQCECYESLTLPSGIDKNKVEATYRNGVLTLTMPRSKDASTKKIAVKT